MKIIYISPGLDNSHSLPFVGVGYYIGEGLKMSGAEVYYLTEGFKPPLTLFYKGKSFIYKYLIKKKYHRIREPYIYKKFSEYISNKLMDVEYDVIFCFGTLPITFLSHNKPKIVWTDASFDGLVDFYSEYKNLCNETLRKGNYLEQKAMDNSSLLIFSSEWAAETARNSYQVDTNKVKVCSFGPLVPVHRKLKDIETYISLRNNSSVQLLFIGGEWDRKNGDLAVKITIELNRRGIQAKLNIMGTSPGVQSQYPDYIHEYGFLNKSNEQHKVIIERLFSESHFLLLPTKADCIPSVILEAYSYGLPCLTTRVGGIPDVVTDDKNGKLFELTSNENDYADYIQSKMADFKLYSNLAISSYKNYEEKLSWKVLGARVLKLIEEVVIKEKA